jgi:hypothetical protein
MPRKVASTFVLESDEPDGHLFRPLHRLAYLDLAFSDDDTDLAVSLLSTMQLHALINLYSTTILLSSFMLHSTFVLEVALILSTQEACVKEKLGSTAVDSLPSFHQTSH